MCEEDRMQMSGAATDDLLEEMRAINSDPDLKQYHLTDARFKALSLHRKIHRTKF